MNEVTKIHLGRQAFTIAADAHRELRRYLDAINSQVHDKGVAEEVELRMAELLAEHGIAGDNVILVKDVDFLKSQLGDPKDFNEDSGSSTGIEPAEGKRLFRDTDNAILAGVAAGLSNYFGIDVLLVRILFVAGAFTGGWGIVIYLVLWLLVPEAKTSSERLRMAGKPVTIDGLKEAVERADVMAAARRANRSLAGPINALFITLLKVVGIAFVAAGLSVILSLIAAEIYLALHGGTLLQADLFPVGFREHVLLHTGVVMSGLLALFVVLFGMAIFQRKWPIRAWITGVLIGLTLICLAAGGALAADTIPQVRDRFLANTHTTVRSMQPFHDVNIIGEDVAVDYKTADTYSVSLNYYDHPDLAAIKTTVSNGTLLIDARDFRKWHRNCEGFCIPDVYNMRITVHSPAEPAFGMPGPGIPAIPEGGGAPLPTRP